MFILNKVEGSQVWEVKRLNGNQLINIKPARTLVNEKKCFSFTFLNDNRRGVLLTSNISRNVIAKTVIKYHLIDKAGSINVSSEDKYLIENPLPAN